MSPITIQRVRRQYFALSSFSLCNHPGLNPERVAILLRFMYRLKRLREHPLSVPLRDALVHATTRRLDGYVEAAVRYVPVKLR